MDRGRQVRECAFVQRHECEGHRPRFAVARFDDGDDVGGVGVSHRGWWLAGRDLQGARRHLLPDGLDGLERTGDGRDVHQPDVGTSALPLNVWSHLAATFDGSTLRLFVNAVQVASRPVLAQIATSTGALTIGGDALYGQYFAGRIDEVRVYETALSASQLQTDMNTPVGAAVPPDTQPPTDPTGLSVTATSSTQINLGWNASSDNVGVTGYRIERCQGAAAANFVQVATPSGTTLQRHRRWQPSTSYSYRVRAADAAGNLSGYSTVQSASTPAGSGNQPPTAPSGLSATGFSLSQINLAWSRLQ